MRWFFHREQPAWLPRASLGRFLLLFLSACGAQTSLTAPVESTATSFARSASMADHGPATDQHASAPAPGLSGKLTIDGSTVLAPLVSRARGEFVAANPDASIVVNGGGSLTRLADVERGTVQIGDSDVFAQVENPTSYADLVDYQISLFGT